MSLLSKLPSFENLVTGAVSAARRFPLPLLSAVLASVAAIMLADSDRPTHEELLQRLLMTGTLGVPWLFALSVWGERLSGKTVSALLAPGLGVVLLGLYYFSLPTTLEPNEQHLLRYAILLAGAHFLVACLPYLGKEVAVDFWHYNKSLFLRFLLAALYASVLYIGLTIALAAADHLFGMEVPYERYAQLWILMAGIAHPWIFLAGVPEKLKRIGTDSDYPKGLALFAQYVLLPLVALYFVILIAYEAKIILEWNLPKGWVSHLVLWFSVVGLLSLLLLHPLRDKEGRRWVQVFSRWFFRALIPLVGMLFFAIFVRLSDYGFTEPRYLVMAMAVGLAVVMVYFLFSQNKDIRIIPIVLTLIALVSAFGPWGAFSVSRNSQQARLDTMLIANELFANGALLPDAPEPLIEDRKEMSSIVAYLNTFHGPEAFDRWLDDSAMATIEGLSAYSRPDAIASLLGYHHVASWETTASDGPDGRGRWFSHSSARDGVHAVEGYEHLVQLETGFQVIELAWPVLGDYTITFDTDPLVLDITEVADSSSAISIDLQEPVRHLIQESSGDRLSVDEMTVDVLGGKIEARLILLHLDGYDMVDSVSISNCEGLLLLRKK